MENIIGEILFFIMKNELYDMNFIAVEGKESFLIGCLSFRFDPQRTCDLAQCQSRAKLNTGSN